MARAEQKTRSGTRAARRARDPLPLSTPLCYAGSWLVQHTRTQRKEREKEREGKKSHHLVPGGTFKFQFLS